MIHWTKAKDKKLTKLFARTANKVLMKIFDCSYSAIKNRGTVLGLKKDPDHVNSGCFKKGHISFNKGKKRSEYVKDKKSLKKMRATQFKKGNLPQNTKIDGHISLRRHNKTGIAYLYIRVKLAKWQQLHQVIWERKNGKIPKDKFVIFKDKNQMNCKIGNLKLVDRQQNMKNNTIHRYPPDVKSTIRLIAKLNRTITKTKENG